MARASAPWLAVLALYVASVLALGVSDGLPHALPQLERLRLETSTTAVELVEAVAMALAFGLGTELARRWVPDPWATRGVLLVALSPLGFAASSGVRGGAIVAALFAGALVLALRCREYPTRWPAVGAAACLALTPWFGTVYVIAALPILAALVNWTHRRGRPLLALLELEIAGASVVVLVGVERFQGSAETPGTGPEQLAAVLVDRGQGLLRWAPVLLLAFLGAYLLVRSRRERLSKAIPARRDAEVAATLSGFTVLALAAAAAFGSVPPQAGLPLAAALGSWGLRRTPRLGALLGLITLSGTIWVVVELASGSAHGWLGLSSDAPWGPLVRAFPAF